MPGKLFLHDAIVIGAGIDGLAAAILLAARGLDVVVLEKADAPGGKARQVAVDGARIQSLFGRSPPHLDRLA